MACIAITIIFLSIYVAISFVGVIDENEEGNFPFWVTSPLLYVLILQIRQEMRTYHSFSVLRLGWGVALYQEEEQSRPQQQEQIH